MRRRVRVERVEAVVDLDVIDIGSNGALRGVARVDRDRICFFEWQGFAQMGLDDGDVGGRSLIAMMMMNGDGSW